MDTGTIRMNKIKDIDTAKCDVPKKNHEKTSTDTTIKSYKTVRGKNNHEKPIKYLRDENTLGLYLKEISKSKALDPLEEAELAHKIRQGDRKSLNKLIKANLKFVVSVCKNYQNQGLPLSDLINEGNLGLIRAAKRFDETKHFKFISYAVWWVRQAILQSLAEHSRIIKLPPNRVGTIHKLGKSVASLEQKLGRIPTLNELSKSLNIKKEDINDVLKISNPYMSLDAPIQKGEDSKLMDVLKDETMESPEEVVMKNALRKEILKILGTLDKKEKEVVKLYFGIGVDTSYTLEEIGHKFSLTRERVRQIKEKAIKRLKHSSRSKKLRLFKT
jgi:RNA polymerase primary sigma factor